MTLVFMTMQKQIHETIPLKNIFKFKKHSNRFLLSIWPSLILNSKDLTNGCEDMEVISLNCGERREYESDLRSNEQEILLSGMTSFPKLLLLLDVWLNSENLIYGG